VQHYLFQPNFPLEWDQLVAELHPPISSFETVDQFSHSLVIPLENTPVPWFLFSYTQ